MREGLDACLQLLQPPRSSTVTVSAMEVSGGKRQPPASEGLLWQTVKVVRWRLGSRPGARGVAVAASEGCEAAGLVQEQLVPYTQSTC